LSGRSLISPRLIAATIVTQQWALTLRRTRIEQSPAFAHLEDWDVLDDGKPVGRIYEKHVRASPDQAWFWSITEYAEPRSGLPTSGTTETFEAAKAAFRKNWDKWGWAMRAGSDSGAG
jgi:hypothetical protein